MTEPEYSESELAVPSGSNPQGDDVWRREIHARVDRYRTRRGRRIEGSYSMRFPFPASADAGAGEPPPIEHPPILSIGEELSQPSKQVVAEPATEFLAPEPADGWNTGSQ